MVTERREMEETNEFFRCSRMWLLLTLIIAQGHVSPVEVKNITEVNPEQFMNISERIQYWGYPSEEYEVCTHDGYFLSLNRIPGEIFVFLGSKAAVLLTHCLNMEGSVWVANMPDSSLAFILADAGYDVWIGNNRGNSWSRRHQHLTIDQEEFWDFSFHEMGIFDLSATIDFILQKTGQQQIYYIGHSQGSSIGFVGFSELPQLAEKIKIFFALAPSYNLQGLISPEMQLLRLPDALIKIIFGRKEFCLLSRSMRASVARKCSCYPIDSLCKQAIFLFCGFNEKNLNKSRTDVYLSRFPDYTSVKNFLHWGQVVKSGEFRYFDYGQEMLDKYSQTSPPLYRIEEITVPIAIWHGGQDWICQPVEIEALLPRITNLIHYKYFPDWNHFDFLWGLDAPQRLYREILNLMEKQL
ncbi:lipase member M-like [Eublepharis macularius]|uniref:Lipase n=1 Tax=Eublepharis macularius TaxID=481883 RepID=A0AA97L2I4_EUBMA|nr:lipase member M-like [Eublepharis macularius]